MAAIVAASAAAKAVVRVGVGCFVTSNDFPGMILLGERMGSHGAGKMALPGGHLEMDESWEECAKREVLEETNLNVDEISFVGVTNDPHIGDDPNKHYITIFMQGKVTASSGPLQNMEPHKCKEWNWTPTQTLFAMRENTPELLFEPMIHFIDSEFSSKVN